MLTIPNTTMPVATWEDLVKMVSDAPPDKRWFNTPCCMKTPIVSLPTPFKHIAYFGCSGCFRPVGGIGFARNAKLPAKKFLAEPWPGIAELRSPDSDYIPHVKFVLQTRELVVVDKEDAELWRAKIITEQEFFDWKKDLGKEVRKP